MVRFILENISQLLICWIASLKLAMMYKNYCKKWVYLLYNSKKYVLKDSKIPSEIESEAGMAEVVNCLKKTNADKEMRARMEDRENSQIYLSLVRGSGYKKGKEEGRKDIIKTMLSNGATKETILKLTGITELEFDNIMNS